jgi:hypothetical protein
MKKNTYVRDCIENIKCALDSVWYLDFWRIIIYKNKIKYKDQNE